MKRAWFRMMTLHASQTRNDEWCWSDVSVVEALVNTAGQIAEQTKKQVITVSAIRS